ncbi:Gp138 family membrane-puncturing spike protein [Clostridium rectalis]|uniref:Gp138 family membrane-puncturing spike protein n=1 Tax=Clostridium rectalis TaxID=2040295 RepID=UPI000F62D4EE|nr:Gp138 family membrane-puncturing spike protein [Clostridium rectalis]
MNNIVSVFQNAMSNLGNNLNCVLIGKIIEYQSLHNTATIELLHNVPTQNIPYQPLINIPIGFFSIGGYSIKVRPNINDVVVLIVSDYDIDNLLIDGKTKKSNTDRVHALEDAIVLPLSINFLNNSFNATEDLTIQKNGTESYVKIKNNGEIVLNANNIKLGENANKKVLIENGNTYSTSSKVYAE